MWNPTMKDLIIYNDGSIQNIKGIPTEIKKLYKTIWEISQKFVVKQAIEEALLLIKYEYEYIYGYS